jgi:hypothetical protein
LSIGYTISTLIEYSKEGHNGVNTLNIYTVVSGLLELSVFLCMSWRMSVQCGRFGYRWSLEKYGVPSPTSHSLYRVFSPEWPIVYTALVFAFGIGESWVAPILPLLRRSLVSMIFCIVLVL